MLGISENKFDPHEITSHVYSLKTLGNPRAARILSYWLVGIILLLFLCLFLPWQQNIEATGTVTPLYPEDRPQDIQSAIPGRIKEWRVQEGQFVSKNDTLVVLSEIKDDYFDPELLKRIEEQLDAKNQGINATQTKVNAISNQIGALNQALQLSLSKARNKYQQAMLKVVSDSTDYEAAKINFNISKLQFDRYDQLYQQGLIARTDWEKRQQAFQEYSAKMVSQQNKFLVAKTEMINAYIELSSLQAEYLDKISKSESDRSSAVGYLADAQAELSKLRNKYSNMVIRNNQYYILAPQDGYIVKTLKTGIGETLKENEPIATIMPSEPKIGVEVYVKAMDVPLIAKGRQVRLEFDGWPALQFTGWPSVSVGTFGGIVKVIDYVDSKEGKYRLLIAPDPNDEPWPEQLRVGSGVYGWVMLEDVPVWFEFWRQLNGFPPSLYEAPDKDEVKEKKSDKKIKIKVKR